MPPTSRTLQRGGASGVGVLWLILVLVGCTAAPGASTTPSSVTGSRSSAQPTAPSPSPSPTGTRVPTPTPASTPNPLGLELRARIVAFAAAAVEATSKIARKVPIIQDVRHLAAFEKTVAPLDSLAGREVEWASGSARIGASGVATCALFVAWWNTAGAGSVGSLDAYQGATPEMKTESLYFAAISDVILGSDKQRKLDSALAVLGTLNERVATLADEVSIAADPCSIATLP